MSPKILEAQHKLAAFGYDPGPLDGVMGRKTREAVIAFQIAEGLTADGILGPQTLGRLLGSLTVAREPGPMPAKPEGRSNAEWPRQRDVAKFFGGVGAHQTKLILPYPMRLAWDKEVIIRQLSIHELVHDSAKRAFSKIAEAFDAEARAELGIDSFGGCLNVRMMRGGSGYSMHSWGIAIDFDPERNQLHWGDDRARLAYRDAEKFWQIWEEEGWISLGRERNFDWMHVQAARLNSME